MEAPLPELASILWRDSSGFVASRGMEAEIEPMEVSQMLETTITARSGTAGLIAAGLRAGGGGERYGSHGRKGGHRTLPAECVARFAELCRK